MATLVGRATTVEVYERVEESKLAWKAADAEARIEVELAEKGWGTNVSVSAENGDQPTKLEGWLDAVLDELATPQKRPFGDVRGAGTRGAQARNRGRRGDAGQWWARGVRGAGS